MKLGHTHLRLTRYPTNPRDWRFGFVVRKGISSGQDIDISLGPLAWEFWWRRW